MAKKKKNVIDINSNSNNKKNFILGTRVNIIKPDKCYLKQKQKNQNCLNKTAYDFGKVKYYNC